MYILVCGSKGRYSDGIDIVVLDISDNKEFLAEKLEREVYEIISRSSEKYAAQAYKGFEEIRAGSSYCDIQINDDEYIELRFKDKLLVFYSTGCPSVREFAGETNEICEIKS